MPARDGGGAEGDAAVDKRREHLLHAGVRDRGRVEGVEGDGGELLVPQHEHLFLQANEFEVVRALEAVLKEETRDVALLGLLKMKMSKGSLLSSVGSKRGLLSNVEPDLSSLDLRKPSIFRVPLLLNL